MLLSPPPPPLSPGGAAPCSIGRAPLSVFAFSSSPTAWLGGAAAGYGELIRIVARRIVATHQNAECMTTGGWLTIGGCGRTTDLFRLLPDHLSVMTDGIKRRAAVIKRLFGDPFRLSPVWFGYIVKKSCNVLTVAWTGTR